MTTRTRGAAGARRPIRYPESDGKPMAETPEHRDLLMWLILVLKRFFTARLDVYISGNMMMYYVEGNPRRSVSPDVFVTLGAPRLPERRVYKVWEEGPPTVVFELTSLSTRRVDLEQKRDLYARMGVQEYFLFDPLGEYLSPPLQGLRLADGVYLPIPPVDDALLSERIGVHLRVIDGGLRLFDAASGALLLGPEERAEAEAARAEAEAARAEAEAARAEAEAARARDEALRRAGAEARVAELEARLRDLEGR